MATKKAAKKTAKKAPSKKATKKASKKRGGAKKNGGFGGFGSAYKKSSQ